MLCSQVQSKWVASKTMQQEADKRMANVMRIPGYFTRVQGVFTNTGKLKSADWMHFLTTGILYVLKPIVQGRQERALVALVRALRLAVNATSDRDPMVTAFPEDDFARRAQECQELKLKIIGYLCEYENGAASTELPPVLHMLLHVPDAIYRWNSVRSMWVFTNER